MPESKSYVSWHAAFHIWWGQIWRFLVVYTVAFILVAGLRFLGPILYKNLSVLIYEYEGSSIFIFLILNFYIHIRIIRESYTNHYATFTLSAEDKQTNNSAFGVDHYLKMHDVIAIWWAQTWRMLLLPAAIVGGHLAATLAQHPTAANYLHLLNNSLTTLNLYAIFVLSLWATKESLGDKYRTLRLITKEKNFYNQG